MQFNKNILCIKRTYYKNNILQKQHTSLLVESYEIEKNTDNLDKIYENFT